MRKLLLIVLAFTIALSVTAQELQAKLSIQTGKVSSGVDKKIFQTLQTGLTNFLNSRKWTQDIYQPGEKIKCNFLITIDQELGDNIFKASLTVQAARPVYGTTYESSILNLQDNELTFKYLEFQPIEFNENRVQGNDPLVANLTALLAYYANIIIGLDYDSFSPRGGEIFFQKALNIVNNAPESRDISGWKAFDGIRNRFRLAENLTDNRFAVIHNAFYAYYRSGFDQLHANEDEGRNGILNALNFLTTLSRDNPNTMIQQVFFQGKSNELVRLFSRAQTDTKKRAKDLLAKLDLTNAGMYKEL